MSFDPLSFIASAYAYFTDSHSIQPQKGTNKLDGYNPLKSWDDHFVRNSIALGLFALGGWKSLRYFTKKPFNSSFFAKTITNFTQPNSSVQTSRQFVYARHAVAAHSYKAWGSWVSNFGQDVPRKSKGGVLFSPWS